MEHTMKIDFVTAIGTPLDADGNLVKNALEKHVSDQIDNGAFALLCMGSMGIGAFIPHRSYADAARTAVGAAKGRIPVYVGVSDTSIARCKERIDLLENIPLDAVVATAPYYYPSTDAEHLLFFKALADYSKKPLYLYDLAVVVKSAIRYSTVLELSKHANIIGIKSGDFTLVSSLLRAQEKGELDAEFKVFYSGLDTFANAARLRFPYLLDGMFACTPILIKKAVESYRNEDFHTGDVYLQQVVELRDIFLREKVMPGFTYSMNLLGFEGEYGPDIHGEVSEGQRERIKAFMNSHCC